MHIFREFLFSLYTVQNPNLTKIWSVYSTSYLQFILRSCFLYCKQSYSIQKLDWDSVTFVRDSSELVTPCCCKATKLFHPKRFVCLSLFCELPRMKMSLLPLHVRWKRRLILVQVCHVVQREQHRKNRRHRRYHYCWWWKAFCKFSCGAPIANADQRSRTKTITGTGTASTS